METNNHKTAQPNSDVRSSDIMKKNQPSKNDDYSSAIGKAVLVHLINEKPVKVFNPRTGKVSICQSDK